MSVRTFKRSAKVKYAARLARESLKSQIPKSEISPPSDSTMQPFNDSTCAAITWHPASHKPDTDTTVLIATKDNDEPIWIGYWASEDNEWRTIEGAAVTVTHWADLPAHPDAPIQPFNDSTCEA
jgi:hypothetical protein